MIRNFKTNINVVLTAPDNISYQALKTYVSIKAGTSYKIVYNDLNLTIILTKEEDSTFNDES